MAPMEVGSVEGRADRHTLFSFEPDASTPCSSRCCRATSRSRVRRRLPEAAEAASRRPGAAR
jgi:hypothetical protein